MNNVRITPILSYDEVMQWARILYSSKFVKGLDGVEQAAMIIKRFNDLDVPVSVSMDGIYLSKDQAGNPKMVMTAGLMSTMIKRRYNFTHDFYEDEDEGLTCAIQFKRPDGELVTVTFSMADADQANLLEGKNAANYKKYPKNMLYARCIGNFAKWVGSEVFGGPVYTPEEMDMRVNEDGEVVEVEADEKPAPAPEKKKAAKSTPKVKTIEEQVQDLKQYFNNHEEYKKVFPDFDTLADACVELNITISENRAAEDGMTLLTYSELVEQLETYAKGKLAVAKLQDMPELTEEEENETD